MATTFERDVKGARSGETREMPVATLPKRRRMLMGVGVLVAIVALIWGGQKWMYGRGHQSTDDAAVDGHIVPVVAKVGGYVSKVAVAENDHVNGGRWRRLSSRRE